MFILPDLPYRPEALEPVISAHALHLHHDKHHRTYVDTLNTLLADAPSPADNLEDLIRQSVGDRARVKLMNNAGQAWNHAFFWDSMVPGGGKPEGRLAAAIDKAHGGLAGLQAAFVKEGAEHFGSGWVWLVAENGRPAVITTHDGEGPLPMRGVTPLLVCDLWEHAYYLDHQNDRKGFLRAWFASLANWRLAAAQWEAAQGHGAPWAYPEPAATPGTARRAGRS